jgi:membrane protein implicated in regulation of membrane protease activity
MNQDIVPADKNLRKKFFIFLGLSVIAVLIIVPYFNEYLEEIKQVFKENPEVAFKKSMFVLKATLSFVSLLLVMTGIYLIVLARRTLKSGQYPPPGMRVIRDTRLRTGTQAKGAGISFIVLSCIFVIVACFFIYWPYAFEKTVSKKKSSDTKRNISEKERGVIELREKGGETK